LDANAMLAGVRYRYKALRGRCRGEGVRFVARLGVVTRYRYLD
jgi:hypothetical protein